MTETFTNQPGAFRWARVWLWALAFCVLAAGMPTSAGPSSAHFKQAGAGSHSQKSTTHKFKARRLSEPQKWVFWTPEPSDLRPERLALVPAELSSSLHAAPFSSALPARAPPSHLLLV